MSRFSDPERSDAELLCAHAAGDRFAFAELFGRHRGRLYRLARRGSRSVEDADDVVQEAMLAAHRGARSFRQDAAVGSWLHRIVVNACRDRMRRHAARPEVPAPTLTTGSVIDLVGPSETALMVRAALRLLTPEQRAAVVVVDAFGYSVADAAALLGVAEGTVKSRCSRARARLSILLADLSPGSG